MYYVSSRKTSWLSLKRRFPWSFTVYWRRKRVWRWPRHWQTFTDVGHNLFSLLASLFTYQSGQSFFFLALEGCNRKNFQRSTFHERLKFLLFDWQRVGWANFIAQSTVKEKKIESWICLLQIIYSIISSVWLLFICAFLFTMKNHFR